MVTPLGRNMILKAIATVIGAGMLCSQTPAHAYPLDAINSGISHLQAFKPETAAKGVGKQPPGALLKENDIVLSLKSTPAENWDFRDHQHDPALQQALDAMLKARDPSYGIVVADITDPDNILWGSVRGTISQIPGSVGKVVTLSGFFSELAKAFPDVRDRKALLREHKVVAGEWVKWGTHTVPRYNADSNTVKKAIIQPGEVYTLAEWVDHMIASSANSAASTIWKETVLLRHFGHAYPPTAEQEAAFFKTTPKRELWALASQAVSEPMITADLDPNVFWVGSFWTKTAKTLIPGNGNSRATPLEMARFLLRLEQGRLIDEWSSLEIKKILYTTSRRYRYVFSQELKNAAVFFKSGSLYKCSTEAGSGCDKYKGNLQNYMNSVSIIETPAQAIQGQKRYIVALISNVLRINSAWDHARIGAAIEEVIRTRTAVKINEEGSSEAIRASGGQD